MQIVNPYLPPPKKKKTPTKRKPKQKKPLKKRGAKRKNRQFYEIPLGFNIRLHAPLEYDLIMNVVGVTGKPEADLIEAISYSSNNQFFKTPGFRKMLIQYRLEGCHSARKKEQPSPAQIYRAIKKRYKH